ncbi:MAG: DUF2520 domain-containing protein [Planctomycetes bacterium]|nr:DUF2520 domain-containing protein [Planctomycetota bacterium]
MERVVVVGTGAVARALVPALVARGTQVRVRSRSAERAAAFCEELGLRASAAPDRAGSTGGKDLLPESQDSLGASPPAGAAWTPEGDEPVLDGLLLFAVPDRVIASAAQAAALRGDRPEAALHLSGYHDSGVLAPLAASCARLGFAHPLGSFPPDGPPLAPGLTWCCGGSTEGAAAAAAELSCHLGGRPLQLREAEGSKARYHAAASLVAGGAAALLHLAEQLAADAVEDPAALRAGLTDLLASMLENARAHGPLAALTGPAARGDDAVVEGHLAAMDPATAAVYRALLEPMRAMAAARAAVRPPSGAPAATEPRSAQP